VAYFKRRGLAEKGDGSETSLSTSGGADDCQESKKNSMPSLEGGGEIVYSKKVWKKIKAFRNKGCFLAEPKKLIKLSAGAIREEETASRQGRRILGATARR